MKKGLSLWLLLWSLYTVDAQVSKHVRINEILFNPPPGGFDYIELQNTGPVAVDLKGLMIGNRNTAGLPASLKTIRPVSTLLNPGAFAILTTNAAWLRSRYQIGTEVLVCELSALPSYPDARGTVLIMDGSDSSVLDEVTYSEQWHFMMINDATGIALERIQAGGRSDDPHNWTSASRASDYGTPGLVNSQRYSDTGPVDFMHLENVVFSPDNDGQQDYLLIRLRAPPEGWVATLTVFDTQGFVRKKIVRNALLGNADLFRWDGSDERQRLLPRGRYILLMEAFSQQGKLIRIKKVVVIA